MIIYEAIVQKNGDNNDNDNNNEVYLYSLHKNQRLQSVLQGQNEKETEKIHKYTHADNLNKGIR